MWQDYLLTFVQISFCVTLIPMLFAKEKPPLLSSITTGFALIVSAVVFLTLNLWLAALLQGIVGCQWLALAYQRMHKNKLSIGASNPSTSQ